MQDSWVITGELVQVDTGNRALQAGAVALKNPYVAAAKFVMSKREPELEARKVAQAIADEIGKFMAAQQIPTLKSSDTR